MLASEVAADAPIVEERIWWEIVLAPGDQALVKRNLSGQLYLLAGSGSFIERVSEDGVEFQGGPTLEMQHVWALHLTGKERVERVMDRIQRAKLPEARGVLARLTPGTRFHAPYPQLKRSTDPEFPFVATIETKESEAVTAQHFQVLAHCRQFVAAYPVRPVRPEMPALVDQLRIFPAQSIAAVYGEAPVELKEAEKRNP
ncbi:MAG: hypothetical protein HYS13_16260 [Planctomycetia bacterium]|nr:hypothetical protein [Planctomycetia bacterium]